MSRLPEIPQDQLAQRIETLERDLEQLKAPQLIGGQSMAVVLNTNVPDITAAWTVFDIDDFPISAFQSKAWRVTFTPDDVTALRYAEITGQWSYSNPNGFETFELYPDPDNVTEDTHRDWIFTFTADANAGNVKAGFIIRALSAGTVTVAPL